MSSTQSRFCDKGYRNWLTGSLSLLYVKEGIERIVDTEASCFHKSILRNISGQGASSQICTSCSSINIKKDVRRQKWAMRCLLCNAWLQQIVQHHTFGPFPKLTPSNTNPQLWPKIPFEIVKAYMPFGSEKYQSAVDGDVQGILSLIKNCSHFTSCGRIGQIRLIKELLEFRNILFHSRNFNVDCKTLQNAQKNMLGFLGGMNSLSPKEQLCVSQAILKITELQNGTLELSLNKELELRALEQKQNALSFDQKVLKHDLEITADSIKTFQRDVGSNATNLANVASDVKTLQRDASSVSAKTTKNETDLTILHVKTTIFENKLQKLQDVQVNLNNFIRTNNLVLVVNRFTTTVESHTRKLHSLEKQTKQLDVTSKHQAGKIDTIYKRQEATEAELKERQKQSKAQASILQSQQRSLHNIKASLQTKAGKENKTITEKDITALQEFLRNYYKQLHLKIQTPVVSEKLQLDCLYVDPTINILRETTNPGLGLVNVSDKPTLDAVSQCRQLLYTKDYKCMQIYVTADAGFGKSTFCKHLVDLWCKSGCKIMTSESSDSDDDNNVVGISCRNANSLVSWASDSDRVHSASMSTTMKHSKKNMGKAVPIEQNRKMIEKRKLADDREIMSEFKLLFYITLKESPNQYHVADMIDFQILQHNQDTKHLTASDLLKKVRCLVILDGLDEWTRPMNAKVPPFVNPGIPQRDWLNKSTVFLTTTRSWKLDALQLTSADVDKHVQLIGLNSHSSAILCNKLIKLLNFAESVERTKFSFQTELKVKGLSHFCNVPVILTQLICLWFDKQDLGQSRVQLYCSLMELLLKRADKKNLPTQTCPSTQKTAHENKTLPQCFSNLKHCQSHKHLLVSLCKVAFEALFNQKRELALVFESSQVEILGVDQSRIDLCLKSGILSQSKVLGKRSTSEKRLSFLHKEVQEFLSAIFITICGNADSIMSVVKHFCTTAETMLDMSQVWMFLSGLRPDLARQLLTYLMTSVVSKDTSLLDYRNTLRDVFIGSVTAHSIQKCIVQCVEEARSNGCHDFCLPLDDFVIDKHTNYVCLGSLLTANRKNVKSVNVRTHAMPGKTVELILCQIKDIRCLQKLYLNDHSYVITNLDSLCQTLDNNKSNLTCLVLKYITLIANKTCASICGTLDHVTTLDLYKVKMTHIEIEQLLSSVSKSRILIRLQLWLLNCKEHGEKCRPGIDLSGHSQVYKLYLGYIHVKSLPTAPHHLQYIKLWYVTIAETQLLKFIQELSSNVLEAELHRVTVTGDSKGGNAPTTFDVNLTYLKHNAKLVVTECLYDQCTWNIKFHTLQQKKTN